MGLSQSLKWSQFRLTDTNRSTQAITTTIIAIFFFHLNQKKIAWWQFVTKWWPYRVICQTYVPGDIHTPTNKDGDWGWILVFLGRQAACLCVVYNFCFIVIFSQQDTPAGEVVEEEAAAVATEATATEVRLHSTLSLYLWHNWRFLLNM